MFKKTLYLTIVLSWVSYIYTSAQTLVWQENFDSAGLSPITWTYDFGDGCDRNLCGWGNAELEYYTKRAENVRVENGNLIIEARRENYGNRSFTSGRVKTEGRFHFKYGTLVARIKIPDLANGLWPAFWTLGTIGGAWPTIGEIDIMEMGSQSARLAGLINKQVSGANHWSNNGSYANYGSSINSSVNLNEDFHLYKMVWTPSSIQFFLDDQLFYTLDISNTNTLGSQAFHQPHFILLNMAIGGAYTGLLNVNDITATMPAQLKIDYIKLYQQPGDEFYLGAQQLPNGNVGVFTENTATALSLSASSNFQLNYWNNLSTISGASAYEGSNVWAVRANAGNWFGMGLNNDYVNLSDHVNGAMRFRFKSTYNGSFKIGLKSGDGESWIQIPSGSTQYGFVRDGNWNQVSIPLSAFKDTVNGKYIDYTSVKSAFMFAGDAPSTTADFYFDDIYFNKQNLIPTLGSFSVPAKVLGDSAFTLTPPSSNSTGSFSFSSSDTNVAKISGSIVTVRGAGTSVITATQSASGLYGSASTTANLVVTIPTPTVAAPNPTPRNSADVVSLFSGAFANVSGIDWFPNWGQTTIPTEVNIAGNATRKYQDLNYQGVQFSGTINVNNMSYLHVDIWTPNCNAFKLFLINTAPLVEQSVTLNPSFLGWNSFDIPLTQFNNINLNSVAQLKLEGLPSGSSIVYLDNIYFWKPSNSPVITNFSFPVKYIGDAPFTITAPTSTSGGAFSYTSSNTSVATISGNLITIIGVGTTTITVQQAAFGSYSSGSETAVLTVQYPGPTTAAPNPPSRSTNDVLSIFSNAYTNQIGTQFNPYWNQTTQVSETSIGGNSTYQYQQFNYQGIQLASVIQVGNMQQLHIDVWTPNVSALDIYLINTTPTLVEQKVTLTPTFSGWNAFDIPLSQYPSINLNNITQFKLVGTPFGTGVVYWDNLYFWKSGSIATPTVNIVQPTCATNTGSVQVTSSISGLTFSINGTDYSNTSGIFTGLTPAIYSLTAKNTQGSVSVPVSVTILAYNDTIPSAPGAIIGTKNINQCDTLQSYSVPAVSGLTYTWSVTGTGNRVFSGQGSNSVVMVLKSAGTISVVAKRCVTNGPATTYAVLKAVPAAPAVLSSNSLNVCLYTESAFSYTGVRDTFRTRTVAGATGYIFETPTGSTVQRLNDTTITVLFADTLTLSAASPKFVKVYSTSSCDTSLAKSVTLTRTVVAAPTAITITPMVTNVCGARTYRYTAPALPVGAYGYVWSIEGTLSEYANIDSGDVNSRKMVVTYSSNDPALAGDSIKLYYVTGCGNSVVKAAKLSNTALKAPAAPTAITIQAVQTNVCGARIYRYIAPVLPVASTTAGAATGYDWSFVGTLSGTMSIDSGSLTSRILVVRYTSNAAALAGDSVRVLYTSDCGNSPRKAAKLSNTALNPPTAPASITIQSVQTNVCGARIYRYIAPSLPAASTTAGAAKGYVWSFVGTLSGTMTIDSGSLTSRIVRVRYTSNAAAGAGDSARVLYTSDCGNSPRKTAKLSNLLLNVPATPATVTIQLVSDVCGARKYRYNAPNLPVATATAGAASGYLWTMPTGTVGSTGVLDSGSLSSQRLVIAYSSNAAAGTDSIRVRYTSGCGNSGIKAQKLSNVAKVCGSFARPVAELKPMETILTTSVYPNPNQGQFLVEMTGLSVMEGKASIDLMDMQGKVIARFPTVIRQGKIQENIIQTALRSGMYLIRVNVGNLNRVVRFQINH